MLEVLIYRNKGAKIESLFTKIQSYPQVWIELLTTLKVMEFDNKYLSSTILENNIIFSCWKCNDKRL